MIGRMRGITTNLTEANRRDHDEWKDARTESRFVCV